MLIGSDEAEPGIRKIAKRTNLLGLTATPTYSDESRKGWLGKIFEAGIIYQADKAKLTAEGILSRPSFIPRPTGSELYVSDNLYNRLVREHKDLPEDIIEKLASDARRNEFSQIAGFNACSSKPSFSNEELKPTPSTLALTLILVPQRGATSGRRATTNVSSTSSETARTGTAGTRWMY